MGRITSWRRTIHERAVALGKGLCRCDFRNILRLLDPLPPCPHLMLIYIYCIASIQPPLLNRLFGYTPPPSAGVICTCLDFVSRFPKKYFSDRSRYEFWVHCMFLVLVPWFSLLGLNGGIIWSMKQKQTNKHIIGIWDKESYY